MAPICSGAALMKNAKSSPPVVGPKSKLASSPMVLRIAPSTIADITGWFTVGGTRSVYLTFAVQRYASAMPLAMRSIFSGKALAIALSKQRVVPAM